MAFPTCHGDTQLPTLDIPLGRTTIAATAITSQNFEDDEVVVQVTGRNERGVHVTADVTVVPGQGGNR